MSERVPRVPRYSSDEFVRLCDELDWKGAAYIGGYRNGYARIDSAPETNGWGDNSEWYVEGHRDGSRDWELDEQGS